MPPSLADAVLPDPVVGRSADDLFQFLLGGELFASKLLLQCAAKLGIDESGLKITRQHRSRRLFHRTWRDLLFLVIELSGRRLVQ